MRGPRSARNLWRALLSLATTLVGPEFTAELDTIESIGAIERAIEERLAKR